VTAPDRAPAPPLGETDLQRIEQRIRDATDPDLPAPWIVVQQDAVALVAALRAAWRERDATKASESGLIQELSQRAVDARRDRQELYERIWAVEAERDEFRASFQELFETTRRYRAALEQVIDYDEMNVADYDEKYAGNALVDTAALIAQAALAAPGAGGRATEEQP
jgi:hypothetical protein